MTQSNSLPPERVFRSDTDGPRRARLRRLFGLIARADSVSSLQALFVPAASSHFAARRAALIVFADSPWGKLDPTLRSSPVARFLRECYAPVHEGMVMDRGTGARRVRAATTATC